jgi:hypothetical protein
MTMTSAAYDAIIAEILGGYEKPEVSEEKPKGLGAMTSRAGMKMPEVSDETEVPSSQAAVNKFMTAIASQRGSKAPAFVEKAYDPLTFTSEHMQRAGMKVMDALAMALEDPQEGKIKVPVGEDFKEDYFTNAENILNQMKSAAQDSSLDIRAANLTRGMTSKQTDTQPTVSADSSRDRLELQGEMRDLPVLDDEDAPEVDTRSNELLDKELPSAGLGSRPVAEAQTAPISGGEIREPDFEPPKEEVKEVLFIQKGLTDLGFKPGGVDGAVGGGTRRALRKFQKANGLEITGIMTPEVFTLIRSGEAVKYPDPPKPDAKVSKILDSNFEVFKEAVAQKESSGRYNIMGGYNNHYVGRYQMGKDALEDEGYSYKKRDALLKDPKKQDELFKKFTLRNHKKLTQNSKKYRDMSEKEKLGVLGYAHNQGATAAEEWLYTGVSGKDANGTLGDEYTSLISRYFSLASKRPKARPDTRVASN